MTNLYWAIYKNLENELLTLSHNVFFTDEQLDVYSMGFLDILLRASIEIESLTKELYKENGGDPNPIDKDGKSRDLYFDTDCIKFLDQRWSICKKRVSIVASNAYFQKGENITITPLHEAHKRGKNVWKKAYQNIKHNRGQFFSSASLKNCLYALGALYILNLYYLDNESCKDTYSSKLFLPEWQRVMLPEVKCKYDANQFSDCIFLEIYNESDYNTYFQYRQEEFETLKAMLINSAEYTEYVENNPNANFSDMGIFQIYVTVGGLKFAQDMFSKISHKADVMLLNVKYHKVLNKNQIVYTLTND